MLIMVKSTLQSAAAGPEDDKTATPAVSILQSIERVANVIATTLSKNKTSVTISRPNLGSSTCTCIIVNIYMILSMISETKLINCLHLAHIVCFSSLHSAINSQQFSLSNLHTDVVFPGAGITLDSFRYPEGLPQIHLPESFLLAARGIESPFGKLLIRRYNVSSNCVQYAFHPQNQWA